MEQKFLDAFKEALEIEDRDVQWTDKFREYEEWDSLGRLSIVAMLDEFFSIQIEESDFEQLITVQQLFDEVKKRIN